MTLYHVIKKAPIFKPNVIFKYVCEHNRAFTKTNASSPPPPPTLKTKKAIVCKPHNATRTVKHAFRSINELLNYIHWQRQISKHVRLMFQSVVVSVLNGELDGHVYTYKHSQINIKNCCYLQTKQNRPMDIVRKILKRKNCCEVLCAEFLSFISLKRYLYPETSHVTGQR
jgi:hypothetical protein